MNPDLLGANQAFSRLNYRPTVVQEVGVEPTQPFRATGLQPAKLANAQPLRNHSARSKPRLVVNERCRGHNEKPRRVVNRPGLARRVWFVAPGGSRPSGRTSARSAYMADAAELNEYW